MPVPTIRYFLAPRSPWTYLGHHRLRQLAAQHAVRIKPRPFDLGERIFPASGGLPLTQRPPQRQAYRLIELRRWSDYLGLPLNLHPRFFPVDERDAALMIIAAEQRVGVEAALDLTGACLAAVWAQDRNLADPDTLCALAQECGLSGADLWEARTDMVQRYDAYTEEALALGVFGAPWYEHAGESFWGQDRLNFLERSILAASRSSD